MGNKKTSKESKLSRYMKAPIRFLSKARDLYLQSMNLCSTHLAYVDVAIGCPAIQPVAALPRSFSVGSATSSSATDDYRDLLRAASVRTYKPPPSSPPARPAERTPVSRSRSIGIGRIDEEKPCDFKDDVEGKPLVYGRSRSYAVHRREAGLF